MRRCPTCDAGEREILFQQHFEPLAGITLMDGYDVVVCGNCGLVFADNIPPDSVFESYYASASKYEFSHTGGRQHEAEVRRLKALAAWIAREVPASVRLLDVGCATGELLAALREQGYSDLTGLDLSFASVRYARGHHGLQVIHGTVGDRPAQIQPFDVVVLSAVLEHVPALNGFLRLLEAWLKADACILLEVPDSENFARGFNAPYQEFSIEHINFFSAPALDNLLGAHGYTRVASRHDLCYPGPNLSSPILSMIFRRGASAAAPVREPTSEAGVRAYLERCRRWTESETRLVEGLAASKAPILVWGIGTLCQRLLATTRLREANISAFVDSNPHYQGRHLIDRPVVAPRELTGRSDPILILSWGFAEEISRQIREELQLDNEIIRIDAGA